MRVVRDSLPALKIPVKAVASCHSGTSGMKGTPLHTNDRYETISPTSEGKPGPPDETGFRNAYAVCFCWVMRSVKKPPTLSRGGYASYATCIPKPTPVLNHG
jgi:hypothetical protein